MRRHLIVLKLKRIHQERDLPDQEIYPGQHFHRDAICRQVPGLEKVGLF